MVSLLKTGAHFWFFLLLSREKHPFFRDTFPPIPAKPFMAKSPLSPTAQLLADLIAIPSVNPDGLPGTPHVGEKDIALFLQKKLKKLGAETKIVPVEKGRPNLVARFPTKSRPKFRLLLAPHTDTVSVGGMTIEPFVPSLKNNLLYGRGASDTKGSIAAMVTALSSFIDKSYRRGSLEITFVGLMGEEAGNQGAKHYAKSCPKFDLAIIGEPTHCKIVHAHKGTSWFTVIAAGKAAHASDPRQGRNAILILSEFLQFGLPRLENWLAQARHDELGHATISAGVIRGGSKINIVPASAEVDLDIRLVPGLSGATVNAELKKVLRAISPHLSVIHRPGVPPLATDRQNPVVQKILPATKGFLTVPWCCDATVFAPLGIPSIALGPGSIAQAHTVDEFIKLSDLELGTTTFTKIFKVLSQTP
jgi:acetylornithine deacetylase/succinyl-diaminopimelate desuccinylase-like protein